MALFDDDVKYGFIIMDVNGSLFGVLHGNNKIVLHKFSVKLPKKHGHGGQSADHFGRLRLEKRHNYIYNYISIYCINSNSRRISLETDQSKEKN